MDGSIYEYQPSFILGFHGCDKSTAEKIFSAKDRHLTPSQKAWDWLGHGTYFWEGNLARAWEWAQAKKAEGKIAEPAVLGAIIDLRHCLDLFDLQSMNQVKEAHGALVAMCETSGTPLPVNVGKTPDKAGRQLDCAVLNALHKWRKDTEKTAYDSVRGPFLEGEPIYDGAGFRSRSHIQICVCNDACIKGYFRPIYPN